MPIPVVMGSGSVSNAIMSVWVNGVLQDESSYEVQPDGTFHILRDADGIFQTSVSVSVNGVMTPLDSVTSAGTTPMELVMEDLVKHPDVGEDEET